MPKRSFINDQVLKIRTLLEIVVKYILKSRQFNPL